MHLDSGIIKTLLLTVVRIRQSVLSDLRILKFKLPTLKKTLRILKFKLRTLNFNLATLTIKLRTLNFNLVTLTINLRTLKISLRSVKPIHRFIKSTQKGQPPGFVPG